MFITEELILDSVEKAEYQKETTGMEESQFQMSERLTSFGITGVPNHLLVLT